MSRRTGAQRRAHRRVARMLAVMLSVAIAVAIAGTTAAVATQSPANCNENDFILQVKQDPGPTYTTGQTIQYSVRTGNNDPSAAGCDISGVTTTLTTPDGVVHTLETNGAYPFPTTVAQVGPTVPYVVNLADAVAGPCGNVAQCPVIVATAKATGLLHDNPIQDDPFTIVKQLSGPVGPPHALHFLCYEAHRAAIAPGPVSVIDQFGSFNPVLADLHELCNPVNKNNEDPQAVNSPIHLDGYEAGSRGNPAQGHKILVTDQFGTITEQLTSVQFVKVPAAKSLVGPVGPLGVPFDSFVCYGVKTQGIANPPNVTLQDEFGTLQNVPLDGVHTFCDPANVNGTGPGADQHLTHLNCWDVNLPSGAFKPPANIWINDMFQARKVRLDAHVWELCVPAAKKVLS